MIEDPDSDALIRTGRESLERRSTGLVHRGLDQLLRRKILVVDQAGRGDYRTISEALLNAPLNVCVMVKPGTYNESLRVDRSVTIVGDGPVAEIIVDSADLNCMLMNAPKATVRCLTFNHRAPRTEGGSAIAIRGGNASVEDCRIVVEHWNDGVSCSGEARFALRGCQIKGGRNGVSVSDATVGSLDHCETFGGNSSGIRMTEHAELTINTSTFRSCDYGVFISGDGEIMMDNCEVHDTEERGIYITGGAKVIMDKCKVYDNFRSGISIADGQLLLRHSNIAGGLRCIKLSGAKTVTTIEDCEISYSVNVNLDKLSFGMEVGAGRVIARRCNIHHHKGAGVVVSYNGFLTLEDCDVYLNENANLEVRGELRLSHSKVRESLGCGIDLTQNVLPLTELER